MRTKDTQHLKRRSVLQAAAGSFLVGGIASAPVQAVEHCAGGVLVIGNGNIKARVEREGFTVKRSLADGEVLLLDATSADRDTLADLNGVQYAVPDLAVSGPGDRVETGTAELMTEAGAELTTDVEQENRHDDAQFWDLQWDKQWMDLPEAHQTATGQGVRVAVIDSGIDTGHPDIDPNLNEELSVRFKSGEMVRKGEPQDEAEFDIHGNGHGTQVAGIIASHGIGLVGVAPDAELVSINIYRDDLPAGSVWTLSDLLVALEYARDIDPDVINMSLGGMRGPAECLGIDDVDSGGYRAALERLTNALAGDDVVMVAGAGNDGASVQTGGEWFYPADHHGVVNVSATGPNDALTFYSNYGSRRVDIAAPGGGYETVSKTWCTAERLIIGCEDEDDDVPEQIEDDVDGCECEPGRIPALFNQIFTTGWFNGRPAAMRFMGTSAASPQVAGVAALIKEAEPQLTADQIAQRIYRSGEGVAGQGDDRGAGRVNVAKAVAGERPQQPPVSCHFVSNGEKIGNLTLEVADTTRERTEGLQNRTELQDGHGIIFVYHDEAMRSFWMKDTLIPLDIIFLDSNRTILNIEEADPEPDTPDEDLERYVSDGPAKYVIETNQGFSAEHGVKPGDEIDLSRSV